MTYETLKRSHLKRNIIIAIVIVLVLSAIILTFTRAKYRTTQSIPLIQGTINYAPYDYKTVAMYVDGEPVDTLPEGKYELTSESYCTNEDNAKDESITLSYDTDTQGLLITPMNKKGTKCYLYFEENVCVGMSASECILAYEGGAEAIVAKGIPDFSKTATTDEGMYAAEDDHGTSYYYRGAVNDNWFQFGTNSSGQPLYWRIVRINGDGSIRLIYNGTSTATEGNSTMINTSQAFNGSYNNNAYGGYMYKSGEVHGLSTNSSIKTKLDEWYISNLADEAEYLDGNAGFCGDRYPSTSSSSSNGKGGTGTTTTYYGAHIRLYTNKSPSFKCRDSQDLYTTPGSSKGNGVLKVTPGDNDSTATPIGLITADEVAFAGGVSGLNNTSYYLYNNAYYWTMSPFSFGAGFVRMFDVDSSGSLFIYGVNGTLGVRPVINLKTNITISGGNGSSDTPFVVAG